MQTLQIWKKKTSHTLKVFFIFSLVMDIFFTNTFSILRNYIILTIQKEDIQKDTTSLTNLKIMQKVLGYVWFLKNLRENVRERKCKEKVEKRKKVKKNKK